MSRYQVNGQSVHTLIAPPIKGISGTKVQNKTKSECSETSCGQFRHNIKLFLFPIALSELQNLLKLDLGHVQGTTLQFRKGMKIDKEAVKTYLVSHLGKKKNGFF